MSVSDPVAAYREALERHGATLRAVRADVGRVETARLVTFLVAAVVGLLYRELPIGPALSLSISGLGAVFFFALVVRHRRLRSIVRRAEVAEHLARLGQLRLWRQWREIAEEHEELGYVDPLLDRNAEADPGHAYVEDLDVFGDASLRAILGPTPTPTGVATLRRWLKAPAGVDEVRRRQQAAKSLAVDFGGRESLSTEALLVEPVSEDALGRFLSWLSEPPIFEGDRSARTDDAGANTLPSFAILVARGLPPVTVALFTFDIVLGYGLPAWSWLAPLLLQSGLAWRWGSVLHGYFGRVSGPSAGLRRYHTLMRAWEEYPATDDTIRQLQSQLHGESGLSASDEIRSLGRWLDAADSRASLGHVFFAWVFLWDVHTAWGLERWRRRVGSHVDGWLEALGELEALGAIATMAHDHPSWCWPELRDGATGFEAEGLGHPLIPETRLRTSDVALDAPGRFLLVTGSNMSGKSTLLRSIGLASVMAQAGAPVCARALRLSPLRVFTSMRIQDSLTDGVSLFMAELNRLKALVDAADTGSSVALLYLIDEVLQGTNSEERRIAARRIVAHLLDTNSIGAVTTHDLSLHEDGRLDPAATKVHFREHVGGGEGAAVLSFDYKLRPGLATSRNALKLLEMVGLDEGPPKRETG